MIQTYKFVNKVNDVNTFFCFSAMQHGHATRQAASISSNKSLPSPGLSRNQCKLELRNNVYSQHVVEAWIAHPAEVQKASSVEKMECDYFGLNFEKWTKF